MPHHGLLGGTYFIVLYTPFTRKGGGSATTEPWLGRNKLDGHVDHSKTKQGFPGLSYPGRTTDMAPIHPRIAIPVEDTFRLNSDLHAPLVMASCRGRQAVIRVVPRSLLRLWPAVAGVHVLQLHGLSAIDGGSVFPRPPSPG